MTTKKLKLVIKNLAKKGFRLSQPIPFTDDLYLFLQGQQDGSGLYNVWSLKECKFIFPKEYDYINYHITQYGLILEIRTYVEEKAFFRLFSVKDEQFLSPVD